MCDRTRGGTRDVSIDERVATRIEERLERTRFESVDEYATLALDLLLRELSELDGETDDPTVDGEPNDGIDGGLDDERREALEDQLESLGYL